MRNDTSVRTYIEDCIDFGIRDKDEIIKKLLDKFKFLTKAQAERYFLQRLRLYNETEPPA